MPNVVEFDLTYGRKMTSTRLAFNKFPAEWREAVIGIMAGKSLRSLSLKRVSRVPVGALKDSLGCLDLLDLYRVSTAGDLELSGNLFEDKDEVSLRKLVSDFASYSSLQLEPFKPYFHHLKFLELLAHCRLKGFEGGPLRQAHNLETLHLHAWGSSEGGTPPLHALLKELSPTSCATLRHLRLGLFHKAATTFIREPLLGLCGPVLPCLVTLHSLKLDIQIVSPFDVSPRPAHLNDGRSFYHPSWAQLDVASAGLDVLNEVRVRVQVKYLNGFDDRWFMRKEVAEAINSSVLEGVYPAQFTGLCRRRDKGNLNFDFSTVVVVG